MNVAAGFILIIFGLFGAIDPEGALRYKDRFRIRGDREYTTFALKSTQYGSILAIILGIAAFFV